MTTTDSLRAALKRLTIMASNELDLPGLWAHDRSQWNDAIAAARAALAQPEPALPQRPECFEFALDFLGSPENDQLREYIERLEARAALAQPKPEVVGPTDQELADAFAEGCRDGSKAGEPPFLGGARAVLARYGNHPAIPDSSTCKQSLPVAPAPPAAEGEVAEGPTDEELLATLDKATADFPPRHPEAESLNSVEYPLALELRKARAVLARFGNHSPSATKMVSPAPVPAEGEVAELVSELRRIRLDVSPCDADTIARAADLLEQRQSAPAPVTDPTDEQLLATVDAVSVTLPPLPMDHTDAHGRIAYDIAWRIAMARAVLARWGNHPAIPDSSTCKESLPVAPAPPAESEVGVLVSALRSTADGLESQAFTQTAALITRAAELLSIAFATGPEVWEPIAQAPCQRHPTPVPVAWMYRGEPDFDGEKWRENWLVTLDRRLAEHGAKPDKPIPLFTATALPLPAGEVK